MAENRTPLSRRRSMAVLARLAGLVALSFGGSRAALAASAEQTSAIRKVVEAQLAAFAADDAELAFSLATDSIRQQFGTAQRFLELVRQQYAPVYRPATTAFREPDEVDSKIFQPVELTDSDGVPWLAVYEVQRQVNGDWRINGCILLKGKSGSRMI